ncbi:hypothetical protein [Chondromyces crocatus]|uniref:Uncharacterized protein n=1 Tax=Chondromyces crocatus TaxID=52 RepID=A0A0K1EMJ3_CHOCO|nr:hypothetical protein [Chondromyces crocatus]AKT42069.1 uncharacterized protein CMC5_062920 [Chondromyces crocatus]
MQLPSKTASSQVHLEHAAHFINTEQAWREVEVISPEQRTLIQESGTVVRARTNTLAARVSSKVQAEAATSKARSSFGVRDMVLGMRLMACSDGLLNGPAQRDRSHTLYRTVMLGRTASEIRNMRPREEPELVDRVRTQLAEAPDFPAKVSLLADLDEALERSVAARTALDAALKVEAMAGDTEKAARIELRNALEHAYGRLRSSFPGQRSFVESFFLRREKKKKAADEGVGTKPGQPILGR